MKIYEIGTGYTSIPAQVAAATESVVEELTKAYISMNQPVEIIDISAENRKPNTLPITEVGVPSVFRKADVSLGIIHKVKRVVYSVALAFKLKKILKKENERCVLHFHNQYNMFFFTKLVSRRLRKKAITAYTNHNGLWSLPWEEVRETMSRRYFQEISSMKNADIVFALNPLTKKNIEEQLEIPENKVFLISNGVNTDEYRPLSRDEKTELKKKYSLEGRQVILQVGSVYENKGQARVVELLCSALKNNKNLVYAYAGGIVSQEYHNLLKQTAESLGISQQVIYLGTFSPGEEMNCLYNIADSTIFASEYEGFPLVCIESLSCGIPVILCSDLSVEIGNGILKADKNTIDEVITGTIINKSHNYEEICRKARSNAVENYSWKKIAENYLKAFKGEING